MKHLMTLILAGHLAIGSVSVSYGDVASVSLHANQGFKKARPSSDRHLNGQRKSPKEIWMAIKAYGQSKAGSNSIIIVKYVGPSAHVELIKGAIGDLGFGSDPYRIPFEKQIVIETLRRALSEPPWSKSSTKTTGAQPERLWESYLKPAEALVLQSIKDIEATPDVSALKKKLKRIEEEIDTLLYINLFDAIERRAQKLGFDIIYGRGDEVKKFTVKISSTPDGARIFVMTDVVYQKQLILNVDIAAWPWQELVQNPASLLGKYHYLAIWPDGSRSEGSFEIDNASPLEVKH
jgi:hypothetical protein